MTEKELKFGTNGKFISIYDEKKIRVNMSLTITALDYLDRQVLRGKALNRSDYLEKLAREPLPPQLQVIDKRKKTPTPTADVEVSPFNNISKLEQTKVLLVEALKLKKSKKGGVDDKLYQAISLLDELINT